MFPAGVVDIIVHSEKVLKIKQSFMPLTKGDAEVIQARTAVQGNLSSALLPLGGAQGFCPLFQRETNRSESGTKWKFWRNKIILLKIVL